MITPTQWCRACMSTDIIYFVHWHVEASRSREDDQDYTVLDRFAGFDNETLAKVFEHVTGTGRRQCNQLPDISWRHSLLGFGWFGTQRAYIDTLGKFGKSTCRCHYCSPTVPLCHVTEHLPIPHQEASLASLWDHFVPLVPCKSANETLESQEFERHGLRLK